MNLSNGCSDAPVVAGLPRCIYFNGFLVEAFRCGVAGTAAEAFQGSFAFALVVQQLFGWMEAAFRVDVSVLWGGLTQNLLKVFSPSNVN